MKILKYNNKPLHVGDTMLKDSKILYTLTLLTDGNGTLTATALEGYEGDTVTLTPTYNTYYRFNNYTVSGGNVSGNTFTFGKSNATVKANFKDNTFTASGSWKSNGWPGPNAMSTVAEAVFYSTVSAHSSNVPSSFYSSNKTSYQKNVTTGTTDWSGSALSWTPSGSIKNYVMSYNITCYFQTATYTSNRLLQFNVGSTVIKSAEASKKSGATSLNISGTTSTIGSTNYVYGKITRTSTSKDWQGVYSCSGSWSASGILP